MRNIEPGLEIIKEFEAFRAKPYRCPAGVPTIGYGTITYPDGRKVTLQDSPIDEETATEYLKHHCQKDCAIIEAFLKKKNIALNDNQFSALVSFAYNLGTGAIVTPGRSLCEALQSGSNLKVSKALMLYTKATVNGKIKELNGLKRRRTAEAKLYCS